MFLKTNCEKCVIFNGGDYTNSRFSIKYNALGVVSCMYDKLGDAAVSGLDMLSDAQIVISGILDGSILVGALNNVALTNGNSTVSVIDCSSTISFGYDEEVRCFSTTAGGTPEVQLEVNYKYNASVSPKKAVAVESVKVLESTNPAFVVGDVFDGGTVMFNAANFELGGTTLEDGDQDTSYIEVMFTPLFEVPCAICVDCA